MEEVIIKRSKYRYKLVEFYRGARNMPKTRCGFFWAANFYTLLSIFLAAATVWLIGTVLLATGTMFELLVLSVDPKIVPLWKTMLIHPWPVLAIIVGVAVGIAKLQLWAENRRFKKAFKAPKPDGEFKSYLKDKKAKFCPLVKYED